MATILRDTAIGFCSGYTVYTKFLESVVQVFQTTPRVGWLVSTISGPAMMDARRDVVKGFIQDTTADYLMMVDSDIEFHPEDLGRMYQHLDDPSVGAASGLYVDSNGYPVAGSLQPDGGYLPLKAPPTEPTPVDVCGAGFLMLTRSALEKINPEQAFDHIQHPSGKVLGEDVSLCTRLKTAGLRIILDPGVFLGHLKVRRIYPNGKALP